MAEKIIMKGNEALAEAAISAGCRHFFGYPITPQTEVAAHMAKRLPQIGGTFLQAESEIAAINMVLGAAAAGVRAMTSSSSPGVSLKSEGISYLAGCDLPCLIVNVQRGGPGLGGIQPAQSDYFHATRSTGHGDFHILVFAPATVQEMADLVAGAFSLADKYRMPAMVLADGMLGQMMEPVVLPEGDSNPPPPKPWAVNGHKNIRSHNIINSLYLEPNDLERTVVERYARYEEVKRTEQQAEEYLCSDAEIFLVSYGATSRIVKSAVVKARAEGIKAGLIRPITLFPFPDAYIDKYVGQAKVFLSVEMSMGQMIDDIRLAVNGRKPVAFFGRTGGVLPTPDEVLGKIREIAGGVK
ncbi:MAG: 3-methyl-2-oxobutanoate dehydrogenase subunit VorB [Clostridiales bacterium]|nr:3-methyl-2-oxobutanoate dehydrogenase subunit VorB [Clostridiales bacterium]